MDSDECRKRLDGALHIVKILAQHGYQALIAGGYVRDMVLQIHCGDIDIATDATPSTISRLFAQTIGVGEQFGVMVVVHKAIPFEVATFRSDIGITDGRHPEHVVFTDARTDALRRDFTINGMFFDPIQNKIIDYVEGQSDLAQRKIRAIGDAHQRFSEDYLRMLRAIRFAARLDFSIEEQTWLAIHAHAEAITAISPERIFSELDRILQQPHADRALELLHESELLKIILPEVSDLIGVEQPPEFHPEGDVFVHTVKALSLLPENPSAVLAWSTLLHDIGKPPTKTYSDRIRFNNHHHVGAKMAQKVLKRLRAPNALIDAVFSVIESHMNFMNVTNMRMATLKRFLARPTIAEDLELHRADCLASHGDISNYYFVKEKLQTFAQERINPPPLISGKDLIALGLKPGPLFGQILNEVYDLQLDETFSTREEALSLVRERWTQQHQ